MEEPDYDEAMVPGSPDEADQSSDLNESYQDEFTPVSPKENENSIGSDGRQRIAGPIVEDISADDSSQCPTSQESSPEPMETDYLPENQVSSEQQPVNYTEGPTSPMDDSISDDGSDEEPRSPESVSEQNQSEISAGEPGWNLIRCSAPWESEDEKKGGPARRGGTGSEDQHNYHEPETIEAAPRSPSESPSDSDDEDTFSLTDKDAEEKSASLGGRNNAGDVTAITRSPSGPRSPSQSPPQSPPQSPLRSAPRSPPQSPPQSPLQTPPRSPPDLPPQSLQSSFDSDLKERKYKKAKESKAVRSELTESESLNYSNTVQRESNSSSDFSKSDIVSPDLQDGENNRLTYDSNKESRTSDSEVKDLRGNLDTNETKQAKGDTLNCYTEGPARAKVQKSISRGSLHDHDHDPELDYDETELDDSLTHKRSDKEGDRSKELDDELEEGEEPEEGETLDGDEKKSEDEDDGELDDDDDCEEGEIKEPDGKKPFVRPLCRFYVRGNCTWGNNCRFLHPGINDKGNYSLIEAPGIHRSMMGPGRPGLWTRERSREGREAPEKEPEEAEPAPPPPPPEPREETAWERGLRQAKELMKKASKRKEMETNFEEKRLTLSLEDDRENNKENDRGGKIIRDPYYDNMLDDEDDYYNNGTRPPTTDQWGHSGYYENFEVRWTREPDYPPSYRSAINQPVQGRDRLKERRHRDRRFSPPSPIERSERRYDRRKEEKYDYEKFDKIPQREPREPRERRKPGREVKEIREERSTESVPNKARGDEWTDPWRRSKSPKQRRDSSSRSRSRGRRRYRRSSSHGSSYSSYSSRSSRSRSSSYSSYTSKSSYSHSSSYSSRSSSGSRSRSRTPPKRKKQIPKRPAVPLGEKDGKLPPGKQPPKLPSAKAPPTRELVTKQPPPKQAPPKPAPHKLPPSAPPGGPGSKSGVEAPRSSITVKGVRHSPEKKRPSSGAIQGAPGPHKPPPSSKPPSSGKLSPPSSSKSLPGRPPPGVRSPAAKVPLPGRGLPSSRMPGGPGAPPTGKPGVPPPPAQMRGRRKERGPYRQHRSPSISSSSSRSRSRSFSSSSSRSASASSVSSITSSSSSSSSGSADSDNLYRDIAKSKKPLDSPKKKKGPPDPSMGRNKRLPVREKIPPSAGLPKEKLRESKDSRLLGKDPREKERERKPPPPRPDRPDRLERPDRPDRLERPDRPDRLERLERPDRPDRLERPDRPDRLERPDRPDRLERPDRPERTERPERIERPERPDRLERMERQDRPDPRPSRAPEPPPESRIRSSVSQGLAPTSKTNKDPLKITGEKSKIKLTLISKPKPSSESALTRKRPSGDPQGGPANKRPPKSPMKQGPTPEVRPANKMPPPPKPEKIVKPGSPKGKEPPKPVPPPAKKPEPVAKPVAKPAAPAPSAKPKKSTSSRREELLKQLKAVEDAIARKRAKMT